MSYLAANLNGISRARLMIQSVVSRRNLFGTRNYHVFTVCSANHSSRVPLPIYLPAHRIERYATATATSTKALKSNKKLSSNLPSRIPKILKKLSTNKVSLQFDQLTTIRPSLFRNYNISVQDGFEILKSCSQLVDRGSDERIKLVDEAWNEIISMVKTPTKDQLILLLQAYRRAGLKTLDNYETIFADFNCPLDADIFTELMYIMGQNDDTMDNAENMLKTVIGKNIKPTEKMYGALILGYSKQGIAAVEKVLDTMRSNEIDISVDTKTELIKANLINGRPKEAMALLRQSNNYSSDQLYDIIRCASTNNSTEIVEEAINCLPETVRNAKLIVPNLQNICTELVYLNRSRTAEQNRLDPYRLIIQHLPVPADPNNSEYGIFLLKEMIAVNESVSNILNLCTDLIEDKRNLYAIHNCCLYSLVNKLPMAYDFLETLAAKEILRPHYFWPLFVQTTNQTEVLKVIKFATKLNVVFDSKTLLTYVLPRMNTLIDSQETVKSLVENGVRMIELKLPVIEFLLDHKRPFEALEIATRSTSPIDGKNILSVLSKFIDGPEYQRNAHTIAKLIHKLQSRCTDRTYDLPGQVLLAVCYGRDKSDKFLLTKRLLNDYERINVNISKNIAETVLDQLLRNRTVYETLSPIVRSLVKDGDVISEHRNIEPKPSNTSTEIEELEQRLSEFQTNKLPSHGILYRLFMKYVQLEQYDRALEIKKQCDKIGVIETPAMLSTLVKLWTATKQSNQALETIKTIQTRHPNFKLDSFKIVDLATLLITESRIDDAKKLIADLPPFKGKSIAYLSSNLWHLLNAAGQYGVDNRSETNISEEFLRSLIDKGYFELSNALLGTVIKEFIDKKKIHDAVTTFRQYVNEYKRTPQSLSLLTQLIELSNDENTTEYAISKEQAIEYVQEIVSLLKQVHGTENANVSVLLAFASAGKDGQVRKILMNPTIQFNTDMLLKSLSYLKDRSQIDVVVTLARSARGLQHNALNEEKLYEFLLSDFVRTNDWAAALHLFQQIQCDDSSLISKKFNKTLADLLEKNSQPIPEALRVRTY